MTLLISHPDTTPLVLIDLLK